LPLRPGRDAEPATSHVGSSMKEAAVRSGSLRYPQPTLGPSSKSSPVSPGGSNVLWSSGSTIQVIVPTPYPMALMADEVSAVAFNTLTEVHSAGLKYSISSSSYGRPAVHYLPAGVD